MQFLYTLYKICTLWLRIARARNVLKIVYKLMTNPVLTAIQFIQTDLGYEITQLSTKNKFIKVGSGGLHILNTLERRQKVIRMLHACIRFRVRTLFKSMTYMLIAHGDTRTLIILCHTWGQTQLCFRRRYHKLIKELL